MKALYKSIFFSLALLAGMTSCHKDELPDTGGLDNAEKLVVGTYEGEWTRVTVGTDEVTSAPGTIVFSVDEAYSNNVSVITLEATNLDLGVSLPCKTVANITLYSSGEFTYWNLQAANPLGVTFSGKVSPKGEATLNYTMFIKEGRKEVEYNFTFKGQKQ